MKEIFSYSLGCKPRSPGTEIQCTNELPWPLICAFSVCFLSNVCFMQLTCKWKDACSCLNGSSLALSHVTWARPLTTQCTLKSHPENAKNSVSLLASYQVGSSLDWLNFDYLYAILVHRSMLATKLNSYPIPTQNVFASKCFFCA